MDLALLILRVVGGVIMIAHGLPKGPNLDQVAGRWASHGMPRAAPAARLAYIVEVPVGVLYIAGLVTGWSSLAQAAFMAVATWWSVGVRHEGLVSLERKGYDVNVALLAIFLATAVAGGGAYSLDAFLRLSPYWPIR